MTGDPARARAGAPVLAAGLILTFLGAGLSLLGLLDLAGRLAGLGGMIAGAILAAPFLERPGSVVEWWWHGIVTGAMLALLGTAVELGLPALGGLLVALGCILAIVSAALGPLPVRRSDPG